MNGFNLKDGFENYIVAKIFYTPSNDKRYGRKTKIHNPICYVRVWAPRPRFALHVFYFFLPAFVDFGRQILLLWTVYALFTHCAYTVHILKNIKNGSHDTLYTFKNYFATMFSVFSFQFSATISSIQIHPILFFLLHYS